MRTLFFTTLAGLQRERMVNSMFRDGDEDLSNFGRVAREIFSMMEVDLPLNVLEGWRCAFEESSHYFQYPSIGSTLYPHRQRVQCIMLPSTRAKRI